MLTKELIAVGIGDVPSWLAEEGLHLAETYFEVTNLEPEICFQAKQVSNDSELAYHWDEAEKQANKVLLCDITI